MDDLILVGLFSSMREKEVRLDMNKVCRLAE